ncbi:MAG: glycosyltransferase family 4 protein [bacterium]|nr:glycosyltransferase family 4 protein [bacterium]
MKIGINTSFINLKSGIGTYVNNLVQNLQLIQNDNDQYFFFLSKDSYCPENFNEKRNDVFKINIPQYNSIRKVLWEQLSMPGRIDKLKIDVFHSPAYISPVFLKASSIITFLDLTFVKFPETIHFYKKEFYNLMFRKSVEKAVKIITISDFIKEELIDYYGCPEEKVETVHLGVSDLFKPCQDDEMKKRVLEKYRIDRPFFLFVGLMEPRKNLPSVLEAFSRINNDDALFVIVGRKGWGYNDVQKTLENPELREKVLITDEISVEELKILYSASLAFIYLSLYEGFGLPVLEAMACGAPVVTSNSSALPEVAGDAALFADPENVEEISDAMKRIINDESLRKELSQKGFDNIKRFSWKKCAEETSLIYHSL